MEILRDIWYWDGFKWKAKKHKLMTVISINVVIDITRKDKSEAEEIIDKSAAAGVKGRSSRASQDYTGVIGALFEWMRLKLEQLHSDSRPLQITM